MMDAVFAHAREAASTNPPKRVRPL
jgi:hypothetical protein